MSDIGASALEKLRQFDAATVCNVITLFEARPRNCGFMLREIAAAYQEKSRLVAELGAPLRRQMRRP